jgi:DMSO/TMAO reductase YedYZ molybdopterin-dependent catalytic subunit
MTRVTRGFVGNRRDLVPTLPPGQHLTADFPVLSYGPTPAVGEDDWTFFIHTEKGEARRWTWDDLHALPIEHIREDIHCVTRWSKLGTTWRGVSLDTLLAGIDTDYEFVMAHSYDGYTTNLPLKDLLNGQAWVVFEYEGSPLSPEHGGPVRLIVPHLYFWKSAKWLRALVMQPTDKPGFWEQNGYHIYGDPVREQRYS